MTLTSATCSAAGLGHIGQPVDIALLLGLPALHDESSGSRIGRLRQIGIRLRLIDRRLKLGQLLARLDQLLIEVGGGDHGQHIALLHLAADIDEAFGDIAGGAREDGGAFESQGRARQIDLPRLA